MEESEKEATIIEAEWSDGQHDSFADPTSIVWTRYIQSRLQHFGDSAGGGTEPAMGSRYAEFARG